MKGCDGMRLGIDVFLEEDYQQFIGKRIGLVTNMTGVNERLISSIDLFHEHADIHLTALYGPEHGILGEAKEGQQVESFFDDQTGLTYYILYIVTRKCTAEMNDSECV